MDQKKIDIEKTFALAINHHKQNNLSAAQALYNEILKIDPNYLMAYKNLASIFFSQKEYQKAKDCYAKIIKINPSNVEAYYNLGVISQTLEENHIAKDYYEKVITIDPDYKEAHYNLGVLSQALGENHVAKNYYKKAITIDPNYVQAHYNLGVILQALGENHTAQNCYENAIKIDPNYVQAHNNLGVIFQAFGENQKAKNCYEKAIKINPNYVQAHNNLSGVFKTLGENQRAHDCLEKVVEIDPNNVTAHCNLGLILEISGENQKALNCYEKAITINPKYVKAYNGIGLIFKKLKENQKAKESFEKAIEINPKYSEPYFNLGVLYKKLDDNQKAKECFEKLIKIEPKNVKAHNNLGAIFQDLNEYKKAKYWFEKAIEIDPNHIESHSNLSYLQIRKLDDFQKAIITSHKGLSVTLKNFKFIDQSIPMFRLKHDIQQAKYLISKDYKIEGINQFQKIGDKILGREENKEDKSISIQQILLNQDDIDSLLPFYKSDYIFKVKKISGSCINHNKNWLDVEEEYFNSSKQIIYIDDFLSDEAIQELREFCLVSKVWNKEYANKYLGAFSNRGFISTIHLQIASELKQKLPKLFGPHSIEKFWGFKYDSTLGRGINIHADFAVHNLNFWITPDEYNNNKNSGGLKVYDVPPPEDWTFSDYNIGKKETIYKFLKENNANCINVPYKFNRAVLFNSAYFHETDEIDFKDEYEGRRINNTYLFGDRKQYF